MVQLTSKHNNVLRENEDLKQKIEFLNKMKDNYTNLLARQKKAQEISNSNL